MTKPSSTVSKMKSEMKYYGCLLSHVAFVENS